MASSISPPSPHNLAFSSRKFASVKRPLAVRPPDSGLCRCTSGNSSSSSSDNNPSLFHRRWDSAIQDVLRNAIKRFDSYLNLSWKQSGDSPNSRVIERHRANSDKADDEEWDWNRWKKHFEQVDEQERLVSVLKSRLSDAVRSEDYEDAARLKVAIAAAATSDTVGRVISRLNRAVVEERYQDAAFLRDKAGAGLVGWWAGLSEDIKDPHGLIIRITAEHGKYVARSYSPRQLATATVGAPLFEIFLVIDKKGEYKQQAVYLKRRGLFQDPSTVFSNELGASSHLNPSGTTEETKDLFVGGTETAEDTDDIDDGSDLAGLSGFQNILRDMIPGVKVKILKVTTPEKVDPDFISKVIEQIMDEEDEGRDSEEEGVEIEDEIKEVEDETKDESGQEKDDIDLDVAAGAGAGIIENEERSEISIKVVIGGLAQKLSSNLPTKESVRLPAKLRMKGRSSFSFSIEKVASGQDPGGQELASMDRKAKLQGQRSVDNVMFDLAKFIGKEKIPLKVLKDVGELLNLTLIQAQSRQPLSGSTTFHRIETTTSPDPLDGLYIGAHGLYTSEVIHLKRKYGQWKEEDGTKQAPNLEFYEYVEAMKLTGDPYVPAGQVAFRAKVGKRYQLPHKGIIPEEFGVVARYKGQGRLAEPGFRNPRWVDGELVILDGKYIKGGPVVGFVYWAPEYHFLVFFNRLRLQS